MSLVVTSLLTLFAKEMTMHIFSVVSSYALIVAALSSVVIMYRHRTRKDKVAEGITDPCRSYLYTAMIGSIIIATVGFILR